MIDGGGLSDGLNLQLVRPGSKDDYHTHNDTQGLSGTVTLCLYRNRELIHRETVRNLITDSGDLYYATRGIYNVSPATPADATKMTGMKLGTGTTAVAKNGAGAALVTYLSGSNKAFDASNPSTSNLGAGLGVQAVYTVTWGPGVATNSAITEVVIVNDSGTDATSTAANGISRATFSAVNKGAADTLVATWNHKFLGA